MGGFGRIAIKAAWAAGLVVLIAGQVPAPEQPEEPPPSVNEPEGAAVESVAPEDTAEPQAADADSEPVEAPAPPPAVEQPRQAEEACGKRCQAAEKREERDLEAQESMANATWGQFGLGALGLLLVGATAYYAYRAAVAAEGAVEEAQNATAAAEATVTITRKIGMAQLRAYLVLERLEMEPTAGHGGLPRIRMVFKNCGATPSRKGRMRYGFNVFEDPEDVPGPDGLEARNLPDLAPGQEFFDEYVLDRQDWAKWKEPIKFRAAALYAYGQIEYETVFPDGGHFTNFRLLFSSVGRQFPDGRFFACPDGNDSD